MRAVSSDLCETGVSTLLCSLVQTCDTLSRIPCLGYLVLDTYACGYCPGYLMPDMLCPEYVSQIPCACVRYVRYLEYTCACPVQRRAAEPISHLLIHQSLWLFHLLYAVVCGCTSLLTHTCYIMQGIAKLPVIKEGNR